jgi:CubicO group peptidase (beta-lactamase class C family)
MKKLHKHREEKVINLERALQAVEGNLLTAHTIQGLPQERWGLRDRMDFYRVPGFSIALVDQEKIAWAQRYGVLEAGGDSLVMEETIFQAASISKPVCAVLALRLVEAGLLDLDADVNQALRSWQVPENENTREKKVTLRGLLSHTAGLSVSGYRGYPAGTPRPTLRQVLDGAPPAASEPVRVFQAPGEGFTYSGGGYLVVQQLLEDVTGWPLEELAREWIFDPLGMSDSTFEPVLPDSYLFQAATAHKVDGHPVPGKWHTYPEQAAASLWSTPTDLARLMVEILKSHKVESGRVLSPEMTRQMLTPQVGWMGLGWVVVEEGGWTRFDHPGWNEGFHSYLAGWPGAGQGVVWMANGENGKLLGQEVVRGLAEVFGWPGFQQVARSVPRVYAARLSPLVGKYRYTDEPDYGVEIIKEGGYLYLKELPGGMCFHLYQESELNFFCLARPEELSFIKNKRGQVNALLIGEYEYLERVG